MIFQFPFPPSVNESLLASRGRLIKTSKARHYLIDCIQYAKSRPKFQIYKAHIKEQIEKKMVLNVDSYFVWPRERVFTKGVKAKSWIKSIDAHNRLKQLHDALMNHVFEVDDSFIFSGQAKKMFCGSIKEPECFIEIKFIPYSEFHFNNIRSRMINDEEVREKTNRV